MNPRTRNARPPSSSRPLPDVDIARRAADLAERATDPDRFWKVHVALMTRSPTLTEDDLQAVARDFALEDEAPGSPAGGSEQAKARVDAHPREPSLDAMEPLSWVTGLFRRTLASPSGPTFSVSYCAATPRSCMVRSQGLLSAAGVVSA